jgi:hypothetical protein
MDEAGQERAIESLRDWSKWLIGLDFGAGAGCVLILENASVTTAITPFLVITIAFLAISIVCSVFLVSKLAYVAEILPLRDSSGNLTTVFDHKVAANLSVGALVALQLASLGAGAFFFIIWVIIKSVAGGS